MPRPFVRINEPPSSITGVVREYLVTVAHALNSIPNLSWFSGTSPNSALTGIAGDIAINLGSASTSSRMWIKSGTP